MLPQEINDFIEARDRFGENSAVLLEYFFPGVILCTHCDTDDREGMSGGAANLTTAAGLDAADIFGRIPAQFI